MKPPFKPRLFNRNNKIGLINKKTIIVFLYQVGELPKNNLYNSFTILK